jgi:CzcA family heavy metal efflux pump
MLQSIISSSIRLRTLVVALAALLLIAGVWKVRNTPLDVIPEFSNLSLQVSTEALGLSTAEVESLITVPMEADLLNGVPWLRSIESQSITGLSSIEMFFAPGTDLLKARQMVQERLVQAHALPNVSSPPILLQPVSSASRIMNIGLSSRTISLIEMSVQARWNIVPRLVGVPGVANVSVWGLRNRQLQVQVNPGTLHSKGVTLEQIVKTAGESVWASPLTFLNSSTPGSGGFIDTPNQRLGVRHISPTVSAESFAKVPVFGTSLALGEVATVKEDSQPLIGDAILKDGPGLMLVIEKFPGANTVDVTRSVEAALVELRQGMKGIEVDTSIYRPASFIERATRNLSTAILIAYVLLIGAIWVLMGNWRAALVAALTILLSMFAALFVLHERGVNINMMVAAGLLLAIGVIVDDAIQDVENLMRRLRQSRIDSGNAPGLGVIVRAGLETRGPMLYATLVILLVCVPVFFMRGASAAFFEPLVWSFILAAAASMVVALTFTPALSAFLLVNAPSGDHRSSVIMGKLQSAYNRMASTAIRSPVPAMVLALVAIPVGYLIWYQTEHSLVPSFKETDVLIEWTSASGTSLDAMSRATSLLMRDVRAIKGVRNAAAHLGRAVLSDDATDVNSAEVWVSLDPKADYDETIEALREAVEGYPGMAGEVRTFLSKKMRGALTGGEEQITVRVYGHDLAIIRSKAEEIREILSQIEGIQNARAEVADDKTTIEVKVDLDKARVYGLKPGDVRRAASSMVAGITVGSLFEDQKVFDVVVLGVPEVRANLASIRDLLIDVETPKGTQVRLADVADVRTVAAPGVIRRHGVSRRIDIAADVSEDHDLGTVSREAARRIQEVSFPFEYHAQVLGEHFSRRATLRALGSYFLAASIIAFLVLQAALGSWRLAMLSILSVPLTLVGSLVAAAVAGGELSLGSLLGCAGALGLTARNGIMLVRHYQQLEHSENEVFGKALVVRGVNERSRSILATAVSLALFLLPFVVMGNTAGLEIVHPMAVTMLGGIVASTLVALFMIPAVYLRFGTGASASRRLDLTSETV